MYHNHHLHETKHLKEANLLQEEKYRHLTNDPVGKLVCEMAVPTIISMLVTAVYNLADTFFVGLMRSNAATGAVGVVFSLMAIFRPPAFSSVRAAATTSPASWAAMKPPTPKKWPPPA